jgi:ubiquinone/menaquinone biosynthesis C-methylase UbiE
MKMGRFEKRLVNSAGHSSRVAKQAQQLLRAANPQPGQRLLDVGCGNGATPIHLARTLGLAVTGIDVDPEQIEAAAVAGRDVPAARFLTADATRLPFADGEFDLVYTNKATHHIPGWEQALAEMTRVLTPGGHLLYSDFVAPIGRCLPTRRALDRFADEHKLESVHRSSSPLRYTGVLRKTDRR